MSKVIARRPRGRPGLGILDVRSTQETCDVVILDRVVGNPPLKIPEIAAGPHTVNIVCGGETFRSATVTVTTGATQVLPIK